jgi:uroporphyrinogen-III synthase
MRRLFILRPEPGASETLARAQAQGLDAIAIPLFVVEPVEWVAPDPGSFDGLLLTSANAVRHGGEQLAELRGLPVYAVGSASAEAARGAGFDLASTGDAGVDRLLGSLEPGLKLLHLAGADRREPSAARQDITAVVAYRSRPNDSFDATKVREGIVLVHSPRAARRLAELLDDRASLSIAAISQATADAAGTGWRSIDVAEQPTDDALLALAARLCNKPGA